MSDVGFVKIGIKNERLHVICGLFSFYVTSSRNSTENRCVTQWNDGARTSSQKNCCILKLLQLIFGIKNHELIL